MQDTINWLTIMGLIRVIEQEGYIDWKIILK